ncbi:O-antigen ligase family protein [Acuticoccus sediminis]|uniref:O-antigen ligase family protein n=1 Tax=Acuticoccus sediminis TaxID=2184697 RepID=UPI001CFEDABB|nr:O-antigen ligase family protein [Acuticoccus sediminis]
MTTGTWLDDLSPSQATQRAQQTALGDMIVLWGGRLLMAGFFFVIFVGLHPLSRDVGENAGGNAERQVSFLALAALATPLVLMRWERAIQIVLRSWPLLVVFAAMAMTTLWSTYPGVTVRRMILVIIVYIVAVGLASALRTPRDYLTALAFGYASILLIDLALSVAMPGFAYTPLGLAGIHGQKNVAGMAGLMFLACFSSILVGARQPVGFWVSVALLLLSFLFLGLTNSKTSLAVGLLATVFAAPVLALGHRGFVYATLLPLFFVVMAGLVIFATGAFDLTGADWAQITTGDPTFTGRDEIWSASLKEIAKAPWLGHGWGAVWSMLPLSHPLSQHIGFWTDTYETLLIINQSHNGYLDILMHGGIFLLTVVLLFLAKQIRDVVVAFKWQDRWYVAGNVFFGTFLLSLLINNMMEATLFFPDGLLGQFLILLTVAHTGWRLSWDRQALARTR